jgi:hypothetical protein
MRRSDDTAGKAWPQGRTTEFAEEAEFRRRRASRKGKVNKKLGDLK